MVNWEYMADKVVVTGGAGFIGSHLVDELVDQGYAVEVIDDLSAGNREQVNEQAVFHRLDIRDREAIAPVIDRASVVFHAAALPRVQFSIDHPMETHEVNVTGTLNVLQAGVEGGVKKVVFSSSSSVYGQREDLPLVERMEVRPQSPYALHKRIGELYARMYATTFDLPTVSLRYFNIYGPRQDPNGAYALVIGKFMKQRAEGEPLTITGDGRQTRDFTHVRDAVRANLLAAGSDRVGQGEVINIGAGRNVSINRLAELIGGEIKYVPARYEPQDTLADHTRAQELLGWEPTVSIEEGIKELKEEWSL